MSVTSSTEKIAALLAERSKIDAAILSMGGKVEEKKEKTKRVGKTGAWSEWTKKILAENKEAIKLFTDALPKEGKIGGHMKWLSASAFGSTSADWKTFQSSWKEEHPKEESSKEESSDAASASASASASAASSEKRKGPKKLSEMTAEERAAHDVKVAERKVAREALSPEEKAAKKVATAAKKVAKAPVAVVAAPVVVVAAPTSVAAHVEPLAEREDAASMQTANSGAESDEEAAFLDAEEAAFLDAEEVPPPPPTREVLPCKIDGVAYFRLCTKSASGEISWEPAVWHSNKKGERGRFFGCRLEDGTWDTDAEEPKL